MRYAKLPFVCVVAALAITGCAMKTDLDSLKSELTAKLSAMEQRLGKMESDNQLAAERYKGLDQRLEQIAKIPRDLEATVAAVTNYARDVEKKVAGFRDLTAVELDRQNAHIEKVKSSYAAVLDREIQSIEAMQRAIDSALGELKTTIDASAKVLKQALPSAQEQIPPAPPMPKDLGDTRTTPTEGVPGVPKPK